MVYLAARITLLTALGAIDTNSISNPPMNDALSDSEHHEGASGGTLKSILSL